MSSPSAERSSSSPHRERVPKRYSQRSRSREKQYYRRGSQNVAENRRAKIRIPELKSYLVSFKKFLQYQTERINSDQANRAYEKYKKDWQEKQNEMFLDNYRDDAWFRQKYDPQFLGAIQITRKENVKKNFNDFIANFQNQLYQSIDLSVKDTSHLGFSLPSDRFQEQDQTLFALINPQVIDIGLNQNVEINKAPYFGFDPDERTLFAKSIPRNISRFDIYEVVSKLRGFKNISLSEPVKKNEFSRYCWIEFADEESYKEAQLQMSGLMIKETMVPFTKSTSKQKKCKVLKNYPTSRLNSDLETVIGMTRKLDKQCQIQNNPIYEFNFQTEHKKFDTFLLYLRRVHAFDYFTSSSYENQRLMSLKLGSIFLRMQANYQEMQNAQTIFKKIQQKTQEKVAQQIITPDYFDILRLEIEKYVHQNQKQCRDLVKDTWKCMLCDKKFKASEFLAKHIITKHQQIKDKKLKHLMDQAYIKDPNKITNISYRDDRQPYRGRKPFNNNFRRGRREYKDLDEPEGEKTTKTANKPLINYLDI